jgi:hypothetical protein
VKISQVEAARIMFAASRWAQKAQGHGLFASGRKELVARLEMQAAETAFNELIANLVEPE